MPVVKEREYRQMFQPLMIPQGTTEKRFDTDFYVEGFATTFDKPYVMYEYGGIKYCEVIDRNALVGADLSDVIMQFDHSGMVFARNKMAKNKPPSLLLEPQESGLFIAANLSLTEEAKRLYASIDAGLICKMSWAFTVSEDAYNKNAINYWNIPRLEEDDRYFFFTAVRQKQTQRGENENDYKFVIYDKKEREGFVVKNEDGMKITDDILGGPNFWPRWSTNDLYITTMEWFDLAQWIKDKKRTLSPTLQKQFESWGEDTNQLIVLCRKKRTNILAFGQRR